MFVSFFYHLRRRGVPVSTTEFLSLLQALQKGLIGESLDRFYQIARALLVKRVEHYDLYDQAFAEFFQDEAWTGAQTALTDELMSWLNNPKEFPDLSPEQRAMLDALDLDELRRSFEERMEEQDERHDGGSKWVGTGGTSPFGHGGVNPAGVRVGGEGGGRSAVQIASARRFRDLRNDLTLDVRQMGTALKKLRVLTRRGRQSELDLDGTIERTAQNAGDLEILFRAPRKNRVKLLLLMDVGGSMTPYSRLCSRLFSAAHQASHFKAFKSYYFHNCPYDILYENMGRNQHLSTQHMLDQIDETWTCIIVGDAAMAPTELMSSGGGLDYYTMNERSGLWWLEHIRASIPATVWLNPDPVSYWPTTFSVRKIQSIFEMYPLTINGLDDAVHELRRLQNR